MLRVWHAAARLLLVLWATTPLACAEPPEKELNQARGSIEAARAAGAERYATSELDAAVAALRRAEEAVVAGDYRAALSHALDARERAKTSARQASAGQAAARSTAESDVGALERAIVEAREKLTAAKVGRFTGKRVESHRQTIANAVTVAELARARLTRGDYAGARTNVEPTIKRLKESTATLDAALTARSGRRRR